MTPTAMQPSNHPIVQWANRRQADDLRTWVRNRLQGRDSLWPVDRMGDDPPHHLVEVLLRHPDVSPESRFYLTVAVNSLLRECLENDPNAGRWDDAAVIELSMLLPIALGGTAYEPEARRLLVAGLPALILGRGRGRMVESQILRCLLELRLRETPEFWLSKDDPSDPVRNTVICQALLGLDQQRLFMWLASRDKAQLQALGSTLGRALGRRCEADLRFAKALRMILKGKELHELADDVTQIGVARPTSPASVPVLREMKKIIDEQSASPGAVELEIHGLDTGSPELLYPSQMASVMQQIIMTLASMRMMKYRPDQELQIAEKIARSLGYASRVTE